MLGLLKRFWRNTGAATAIEYALIAGLVSVMVVSGASTIGNKLSNIFTKVGNSLQ